MQKVKSTTLKAVFSGLVQQNISSTWKLADNFIRVYVHVYQKVKHTDLLRIFLIPVCPGECFHKLIHGNKGVIST